MVNQQLVSLLVVNQQLVSLNGIAACGKPTTDVYEQYCSSSKTENGHCAHWQFDYARHGIEGMKPNVYMCKLKMN